jgi:hypothetical protein
VADSIYAYFNQVLDEREAEPREDLVSRFLSAEVDGHKLTREDILDICFLFLIAGLDTVTATLDCMFGFLAQHPEHRRQLAEDPSLIPSAIEELLRWETPVQMVARSSLEDTTLAGCPVAQGRFGHPHARLGQHGRGRGRGRRHRALRPRGEPPHRLRWRHPSVPRLAPGPHGAARGAARVAPPHPRVLGGPGHTLVYTPNIRSIEHFPMVFTAAAAATSRLSFPTSNTFGHAERLGRAQERCHGLPSHGAGWPRAVRRTHSPGGR